MIWGIMMGFPTQISTYHAVCAFLYPDDFPSHSRYNRLSANLKVALKIILYEYVKSLNNQPRYAVIDSFPCPLCATIRNRRAKLFFEVANIGYNATKELYYYGFKVSLSVDSKGFPIAYEVTSASVHDVNMAFNLVEQVPNKQTLAVSEKLKQSCNAIGVDLWTPPKKNQKSNEKVDNSLLGKFRKKVETVISSLSSLGIQKFKSRSLAGFDARLEAILLTYSFMLEKAQTIISGTLRYSLGRF